MSISTALVLGGTRYFGKHLVHRLLAEGTQVTVGTRGNSPLEHHPNLHHLPLDRFDAASLGAALREGRWDVVYDQLCYAPDDAWPICKMLDGRIGRYILTSSQAVYAPGRELAESAFDPTTWPVASGSRTEMSYADGKRGAEALLFQLASFPVTAVRLPIVLGPDDYTQRLATQVERVLAGEPLRIDQPEAEYSLISSHESANFLLWLGSHGEPGAYNGCSNGSITAGRIAQLIEEGTGRQAVIEREGAHDPFALFSPSTLTLDTGKAQKQGYRFEDVEVWLAPLIRDLAQRAQKVA